VSNVQVAGTPDQIARGEKLAYICAGCHSTTAAPPLDGGTASFAGPLGSLYPPNLTPGGPLANWSDGEIIRAVREGVDKDGRPLFVMPSEYFHVMSDDDVQSLVAYVRSEKDVQREVPPKALNPLGMVLVGIGVFPSSVQKPITQPLYSPPMSAAVDHGKYLVEISGCHSCHGADLAGGTPGGFTPVGPNLTAIVNKWNEADFIKTIRTGVDPSGHAIAPDQMPWKNFSAAYDDSELGTIYAYLHSLPPIDRSVR
jgi:mono/diheme cytochrome c family protein